MATGILITALLHGVVWYARMYVWCGGKVHGVLC